MSAGVRSCGWTASGIVKISIYKISEERHRLAVARCDGSTEEIELETRSFLRHDLAHFAIESEFAIADGYWGSVAAGASLAGMNLTGEGIVLAELLAGRVQGLMRDEAHVDQYRELLDEVAPSLGPADAAERLNEVVRRLRGHWQATSYGEAMCLTWP